MRSKLIECERCKGATGEPGYYRQYYYYCCCCCCHCCCCCYCCCCSSLEKTRGNYPVATWRGLTFREPFARTVADIYQWPALFALFSNKRKVVPYLRSKGGGIWWAEKEKSRRARESRMQGTKRPDAHLCARARGAGVAVMRREAGSMEIRMSGPSEVRWIFFFFLTFPHVRSLDPWRRSFFARPWR